MERIRISSGTKWESIVGYSRAIRCGEHVYVSGTTATNDQGEIVGIGDPYVQAVQILQNISSALEEVGGTIQDVVRTRIFVTDIAKWEFVAKAHSEVFSEVRPATSMVEVSRLIATEILVEIEAEAIIASPG
jgi:enamine deaminase RidA (YjgF/YER057c/UK114 family)